MINNKYLPFFFSALVALSMLFVASCSSDTETKASDEQVSSSVSDSAAGTVEDVAEEIVEMVSLDDVEVTEEMRNLGKRSFIRCRACHTLGASEPHRVGPNLNALFGANAAVKEGFSFSDALTNSGIVWDENTLRAWLKSPSAYLPGNKMAFAGVADEKELTALLIYLKENTQ